LAEARAMMAMLVLAVFSMDAVINDVLTRDVAHERDGSLTLTDRG